MKKTIFIILSLLICLMFHFSAYAEDTEKADPLGDAMIAYVAKDYKKAVELLEPLADEGNVRAKTLLGPLIFKGADGVDKDVNRGLKMIMDAAKQGDKDARRIAIDLNNELAKQGDMSAMYNMGLMCLNGWGGEIESGTCLTIIEKAANGGHVTSAKLLASIYKNGKYGIPADQTKADEWTQKLQQSQQTQK